MGEDESSDEVVGGGDEAHGNRRSWGAGGRERGEWADGAM